MSSPLALHDWGRCPYREALARQRAAVEARAGGVTGDSLFLVEHDPVLTLGRSAHSENLRASAEELRRRGVDVVEVERGGDITYHGPGQIVGYPIVALADLPGGRDLHRYLRDLEEALIRALAAFGVRADRRTPYTGVWVGEAKIAAIGVAVRRWVSFHGFALNLDPDLDHFQLIHPCGIRHLGVTSVRALLGRAPARDEMVAALAASFSEVWDRPVIAVGVAAPGAPWECRTVPEALHA